MQEFKQLILGNVSVAYYLAAEFFALLALILSLYMNSKKRDATSSSTPIQFSWPFLIWDNTKRIVVGQIALFLIFRFITELLGRQLNMWIAVGIGFFLSFGLDKAIQLIKEKSSIFDMNREKMIEKISTTGPMDTKKDGQ
jgi:hypothetical protein